MLNKYAVICFLLSCFLLNGCEASFDASTASLTDAVIALEVDQQTQAPLKTVESITPDTKTIYASIKVNNAPSETAVKAVFHYKHDGNENTIAENSVSAQGTQYVSFSLSPPETGWPIGEYSVQFLLNDKEKQQIHFSVSQETAAVKSQLQEAQQNDQNVLLGQAQKPGTYQRLNEQRFGFSYEVPSTWSWKLIPESRDYLISGPSGTDEGEISVIMQIIDPRLGGVKDVNDQMAALEKEFTKLPDASIVNKDMIKTAGQESPFFVVTYMAKNSQGTQVKFGHTQIGIDHSPYILLLSYSAPMNIYQNNIKTLQHILDTMVLESKNGKNIAENVDRPDKEKEVHSQATEEEVNGQTVEKVVQAQEASEGVHTQEERYIAMLESSSLANIRNAAKIVYRKRMFNDAILESVNKVLLSEYKSDKGKLHADAMSWLCKILGSSGKNKYKSTLEEVAVNGATKKLRNYAASSSNLL